MIDPGLIDMIMRIRGRGISDNAVLRAMELVARKHFVAKKHWDVAYDCLLYTSDAAYVM